MKPTETTTEQRGRATALPSSLAPGGACGAFADADAMRKLALFGWLRGTVVSNSDLTEPASKARAKNL